MNAFWALVKNDTNLVTKFTSKFRKWFLVYFIGAILIGLIQYTIFLINTKVFAFQITNIFPVFIIIFILISGQIISKEKRQDTIGWWLTLPYSRKMLLGTKITASFIRFLKYMAAMLITITVLFLEAYIIRPDLLPGEAILKYLIELIQLLFILLAFSPFAVLFGIIIRLLGLSKWRPAVPLFWISIPAGFTLVMSIIFGENASVEAVDLVKLLISNGKQFSIIMLLEVLLVTVLYFLSVYILENKVEV
jgi:hypothetical protein